MLRNSHKLVWTLTCLHISLSCVCCHSTCSELTVRLSVNLSAIQRDSRTTVTASASNYTAAAKAFTQIHGLSASTFEPRLAKTLQNMTRNAWLRNERARVESAPQIIPRRYFLGDKAALKHMEKHGYVVYRSVCTNADIRESLLLLWRFLENSGLGIKRADPATWHDWPENKDVSYPQQ